MYNPREKFISKSRNRLTENRCEKIFSDAWVAANEGKYSMLELLFSDDGGQTPAEVTDRDELVAATVIQWLGSPVGFSWLTDVIDKIELAEK